MLYSLVSIFMAHSSKRHEDDSIIEIGNNNRICVEKDNIKYEIEKENIIRWFLFEILNRQDNVIKEEGRNK